MSRYNTSQIMKNQETIKVYSLGCRLNALEAEKIRAMLNASGLSNCVIINTCAVTNEALRQSRQQLHKIIRENPDTKIFVTGCGAELQPLDFKSKNVSVISNKDKFNPAAYNIQHAEYHLSRFVRMREKGFVQIGDGCNRACTYCITRILRGPAVHFPYERILADAKILAENGYKEIILTGVNIADWYEGHNTLPNLCKNLLHDLPKIEYLTLSSLDPAADIEKIIELTRQNSRMTKHLHLSVQSGCDKILRPMARRHTAGRIRDIHNLCRAANITVSWDIICGFPGETIELFNETLDLANELKPIKIHAFPFSARPGTPAATMPDQISRAESKKRVKILSELSD